MKKRSMVDLADNVAQYHEKSLDALDVQNHHLGVQNHHSELYRLTVDVASQRAARDSLVRHLDFTKHSLTQEGINRDPQDSQQEGGWSRRA
jgi:hypothetical protein